MELNTENAVLKARKQGKISSDAAFEHLYGFYAPTVRAWARLNSATAFDDLAQDVWFVFYQRWHSWTEYPGSESQEGRPVLSFLYRTFQFVLKGYKRRLSLRNESLHDLEISNGHASTKKMMNQLEANLLLDRAARICSELELQILHAKLAGLQAAEIADVLTISASSVDHGFRNAVARLRMDLKTATQPEEE